MDCGLVSRLRNGLAGRSGSAISASKRLLGHLSECRAGEQVQDFGNPPAVLVAAE
jgi:hypothetical protein